MAFENESAATKHGNDHLNAYTGGLDLSAGAEAEGTLQQHAGQGFFRSIEDPGRHHLSFQDRQIHTNLGGVSLHFLHILSLMFLGWVCCRQIINN